MPLIAVVRHAQASFGAADYDQLSAVGREQAEVVGAELARRQLRDPAVVTGRLRRQQDTAGPLAAAAGIAQSSRVDERWDEYDHFALLRRYVDPERIELATGDSAGSRVSPATRRPRDHHRARRLEWGHPPVVQRPCALRRRPPGPPHLSLARPGRDAATRR